VKPDFSSAEVAGCLRTFFTAEAQRSQRFFLKGFLCVLCVSAVKMIIFSFGAGFTLAGKVESQALIATVERSIMHFQETSLQRSVDSSGGATGNEF
jgi:hypothetical protein